MIKLEKIDNPAPVPLKMGRPCTYPLREMAPGDSFIVSESKYPSVRSLAYRLRQQQIREGKQPYEFAYEHGITTAKGRFHCRVWRVK